MYLKVFLIFIIIMPQYIVTSSSETAKLAAYEDSEDGRSSLVFVFDTTGSMYNDLKQLREGAEMILDTALEESNVIADFVFVPFHDPTVGPATVTRDKEVFKSALNIVHVYGGGDCPEKSLGGIQLALNVSRPRSYVYVFTDATAGDHRMVGRVLDAVQRKQSQVVFVLTGHCNDLHKPSYKVYQQIAAASSGQVFNLNKTNVHKVLDFVRTSIKGRTVNLGSIVISAGRNYTQGIPVDSSLGEVTVSVSGAKPKIRVVDPSGQEVTGPPKLITTLDLSEIMVVKVLQPEPGNWTITTGGDAEYSVRVMGLSNVSFSHGFSVEKPAAVAEASYRPLQGAYNYMLISLTQTDIPVHIHYAEILALDGKTLFEIPLKVFDGERKIYIADPFVPPDDFFYVAISGRDEYGQELRRIGATAVQAKAPDVPYLTVPRKIGSLYFHNDEQVRSISTFSVTSQQVEARLHESVALKCTVESLVPVTAMWTKDSMKIQNQTSSLQSTWTDYIIEDMREDSVGTYRCVAKNVAGINRASTDVILLVRPPHVTVAPENRTVAIGDNVAVTCAVTTEALLTSFHLVFEGIRNKYANEIRIEPNVEGFYSFNETLRNVTEENGGVYSCIAQNRGGQTTKSTYLTIQTRATAQILGPHTLTRLIHSAIQLACHVENAEWFAWEAPNGTIVNWSHVNGSYNGMLDVGDVSEDGVWSCVAGRDGYRVKDSVEISIQIKPEATVVGPRNVTILNGTIYEITCHIVAKPPPRIIWHRETDKFLNNTVTVLQPNVYKTVLALDSSKEAVNGTYFCFGENHLGIAYGSVSVNLRREMTLVEGFTDKSIQLYSQVELTCRVNSHPRAYVQWYHNGTSIEISENNPTISENSPKISENIPKISNNSLKISNNSLKISNNSLKISDNIRLSDDGATLYLLKVDFIDLGLYGCEADNGFEKLKVEGRLDVVGLEIPVISKEPSSIVTQRGKSAIITCRVMKGSPEPTITWQYRNSNASEFTTLPSDVMSDDRRSLNIRRVHITHYGTYRCIAENVMGKDMYDVLLLIQYPPELTEVSNASDRPLEVEGGQKVTFSCKSAGFPPPVIVWSKNHQPISYSKNMYLSDSELVIEAATQYDSGLYTCNVTSALGAVERNFTLLVYVPPIITAPGIEPQLEVLEGQLVELPCSASGVPKPSVQWLQNGVGVAQGRKHVDEFGLRFVANVTDFGEYTCVARNEYGNSSLSFTLYIWVAPYIEPPLQTSAAVLFGSDVILECNAVGFPIPTVVWEFDGELLEKNTTRLSFNDIGNVFVKNASATQEGTYACIAENIAGVAVKTTYLNVNEPPTILEDFPGPYLATSRDTALVISCRVTGAPRPYVIWAKDGMYIDADSRYDVDLDGALTIKLPTEDLSGIYTCMAKNTIGQANRSVEVKIYPLPNQMQSEESQATVTVLEGRNASIECPVRTPHTDIVKWYKDAKLLAYDNLIIPNISRDDASTYACVAINAVGSVYSKVTINVEWPPKFVEDVKEYMEVVKGNDWYFDCRVEAKPGSKVKWLFNSKPLYEDKERLKIINVQQYHTGAYKCIVGNVHATITRQFALDVLVPPSISQFDVLDVQLREGDNATLECNASGIPQPDISWTYNNINWHTQNLTLSTTNISTNAEGLYRCDASNKAGTTHIVYRVTVGSAAAVREVVAYSGGEGVTVVGGVEVELGTHIRLSCIAKGNPLPQVQWIRNGIVLSGNSANISYADLALDGVQATQGLYACVASNEGGTDERRVKVEVLEPPTIFQVQNSADNVIKAEVISGLAFYLHCHALGNPSPEIYWFRDGQPLRFFDDTMVSKDYGEVIVVERARYDQSGNYTCVARNKLGDDSAVYLVEVLVPPPTPKESLKPITTRLGRPLSLTCPVEGSPMPHVTWLKHPYTDIGEDTPRVKLGDENFTLLINSTLVSDSGKYSCIMTNKVGTTEVVFDVTVEKAPSIAGNVGGNVIESHTVALRRSVVLKCQVEGNPLPKISWLKDTHPLSDSLSNIQKVLANSLLAIWSADLRDAGQYICVAENAAGAAHRRYNVVVQVPGKWSPWSQWSYCNATCGQGYQLRTRSCQYIDERNATIDRTNKSDKIVLDESSCKGSAHDRRKCHMPPCEDVESGTRWSVWSRWSACSTSCGAGSQARTRRCKGNACLGDNVQIRKCPDLPKCSRQDANNNEDYDGKENTTVTSAFIPEAVFEMQPEVVGTQDVEEIYMKPELKYSMSYYDVNVTDNLDGSDPGSCAPGHRLNGTTLHCDDIDECAIERNRCHSTQACVNTAGAYRCACAQGFTALGVGQRCLDLNECLLATHGCEFACVNVAGGYVCACPPYLRLHADRRRCVTPSSYRKPYSYEELDTEDYLGATIDFPARYTKTRN